MIPVLTIYLSRRFENDPIYKKGVALLFVSFLFIQDFHLYFLSSLLFAMSLIDLREKKIPNELNLAFFLILLVNFLTFNKKESFFELEYFISITILIILILLSLSTDSLGFADVKMLISIFLFSAPKFFISVLFFMVILLAIAIIWHLLVTKNMKGELALAPFISSAFILTYIF